MRRRRIQCPPHWSAFASHAVLLAFILRSVSTARSRYELSLAGILPSVAARLYGSPFRVEEQPLLDIDALDIDAF